LQRKEVDMKKDNKPLLGVWILNVSKRKLQQMRTDKEIKFRKSGKKIYYKSSDVEAYINRLNRGDYGQD